eukprot:Tbor_TRINITY_DN5351_c3_g3::TRINITY_DN5351_c3_g3_i1::g.3840::m.3840
MPTVDPDYLLYLHACSRAFNIIENIIENQTRATEEKIINIIETTEEINNNFHNDIINTINEEENSRVSINYLNNQINIIISQINEEKSRFEAEMKELEDINNKNMIIINNKIEKYEKDKFEAEEFELIRETKEER